MMTIRICTIVKSVKIKNVKKGKLTLKKEKTFKIKVKLNKVKKGKRMMPSEHVAKVRCLSTDKTIATVSKKGKLIAK